MIELSSHHGSLLSLQAFFTIRPYKSIYANLNPPQPTRPSSQLAIEPTQEDVANCFDNDHEIFLPLDFSPIQDAAADEESNLEQVLERPNGLVVRDVEDISNEAVDEPEGSLSDHNKHTWANLYNVFPRAYFVKRFTLITSFVITL